MFAPIKDSKSAADRCAEAIRQRILSGELAAGERLPAERDLAERLGVNRLTLRAALTELRAAGLIKARQGSGNTVQAFEATGGPGLLPSLIRVSTSAAERVAICADLLLLRRHLAAAALTRLVSEPFDPAPIADAVQRFVGLAEAGAPANELAAADLAIVAAVLGATGSMAFRLILNPLSTALEEFPQMRDILYKRPAENAAAYQSLLRWLEAPDRAAIAVLLSVLEARDRASVAALATALTHSDAPDDTRRDD